MLIKAEQLVPPKTMAAARALMLDPSTRFDCDSDSVDGNPTFEIRWVAEGEYTHAGLETIFRDFVDERLLPLVRSSSLVAADQPLVLCEALVRMYNVDERRVHPAHYDADALITAVLELDTTDGSTSAKGFTGGFYVQPGAHVESRVPLSLDPGDVLAHSFDLQHGVDITAGRRCSVVFWFTPSIEACTAKTRPWYIAAAEAGDADAQYNHGKDLDRSGTDPVRAQALVRAAAEQGLPMAQNDLAAMVMAGRGSEPDMDEAERWWARAAAQGFYRSMYGLAVLYSQQPGRKAEAFKWLERAALQRADPDTLFRLGLAYRGGVDGATPPDASKAKTWLQEAAVMGHPGAQHALGVMLLADADAELEAEMWLQRASGQLHPAAAIALGRLYLRRRDAGRLLSLVTGWGTKLLRASSKARGMSARLSYVVSAVPIAAVVAVGGLM